MGRTFHFLVAGVVLLALTGLPSCKRHTAAAPDNPQADSLVRVLYRTRDYDGLIALMDKMQETGELSPIKCHFWRGYALSRTGRGRLADACWEEAMKQEIRNDEDLDFYFRSGNRLSDHLLLEGEYEKALRVALPVIAMMREAGMDNNGDYAHLLITIGCCELYQGNVKDARDLFYQADEQFRLLLDDDWSTITNHTSAISGIETVIDNSLQLRDFEHGFAWTERLRELYEDYARLPDADPEFVDKQMSRYHIYRAWALAAMGRSREAEADYQASLATDYGRTDEGKLEAVDYLMAARRWSEAADNYAVLDSQIEKYNIEMTLNTLPRYLLPKLRANGVSGRGDSAIAIGRQVCLALDSAIVWNRQDRAAEIAQIYESERMETELIRQKAEVERINYLALLALLALIILAGSVHISIRYRTNKRLKAANEQLMEANARAEESSRMKTAFIQQISHEIRTPLNTLSGFSQVLTSPELDLDDEARAQINEAMVDGTERITGLVNKILALSDVVSTAVLECGDTVPPRQIALEAASTSGIRRSKQIQFKLDVRPDADEILLQTNDHAASQVLVLLLENAEKFTTEGKVFLRVYPEGEWVRFAVEDTGIGVPPEEAEHIFEQFVQLNEYTEGTGLGLTVARSISRRLGGEVVLDTSYSPGARFVFSLPKNV